MKGQTISHYRVLEKLGEGGMGEVYLAEDSSLKRRVALKVLPEFLQQDPISHKRFIREAGFAAALGHPFICNIHEVGQTEDGQDFIVMEYVQGKTLQSELAKGPLSLKEALRIGVEVAEALEVAHDEGIVHRDLKPSNIMLTPQGHPKVLDFGLAKKVVTEEETEERIASAVTREGSTPGTLPYMSPEQIKAEPVDHRSDIFSFGIILYEMLAGAHPFRKASQAEIGAAILGSEVASLNRYIDDTPELLQHTVQKMLAKDMKQRYQAIHEVWTNLNKLAEVREGKRSKWEHWKVAGIASLVLLAAVICAWFVYDFLLPSSQVIDSLAVLRFEAEGGHPDLETLTVGIPESLISKLSPLPTLRVISSLSSFHFSPSSDLSEIRAALDVEAVVAGRLVWVGEEFSVNVQLVDTRDSVQLWGQQYSSALGGIFETQQAIAEQIGQALRIQLTDEEKTRLAEDYTRNTEAYLAYVRGRRILETADHLEKAVEYFQDAIAADPNCAPAYAGLATIRGMLGLYSAAPLRDLLPQLRELARKALEIDDSLAESHAVLGLQKVLEHKLVEAERDLRRAIELNPARSEVYGLLARFCLAPSGKLDDAIAMAKKGLQVDPFSPVANFRVGACYYTARLYDEAIPYFRMALDLDPTHWASNAWLGLTYVQKEMYEEARAQFALVTPATCPVCPPGGALSSPAFLAMLGEREGALKALEDLQFGRDYSETTYAVLGEIDKAFEWLEKNIDRHKQGGTFSYFRLHLKVDPIWDHLRKDPGFPGLLRRANLEP